MLLLFAAAAAAPPPTPIGAAPAVSVRAERGAGPAGPWGTAAVGLGADVRRAWAVRAWLPVAAAASVGDTGRVGLGAPWISAAWEPARAGTAPLAAASVTTGLGDADVVQRAWVGSAYGGVRVERGDLAVWALAGIRAAPGLRPVRLGAPVTSADPASLAHGRWTFTAPDAPHPVALADPTDPWTASARLSVGWRDPGLLAATMVAAAGARGPDVAVGLVGATSATRPVQFAGSVEVPVVSTLADGVRLGVAATVRPGHP